MAIARSTQHQVSRAPTASAGSGRRPLLNGNQIARKTNAADHTAGVLCRTARPRRGMTSRLMSHQPSNPRRKAGSRMNGAATLTSVMAEMTWKCQPNGSCGTPK